MSVSVIWNKLSAKTLSKDYFYILNHIIYNIPSRAGRLSPLICLTFEMLAFLSYVVISGKKSTMTKVQVLLTITQIYTFSLM